MPVAVVMIGVFTPCDVGSNACVVAKAFDFFGRKFIVVGITHDGFESPGHFGCGRFCCVKQFGRVNLPFYGLTQDVAISGVVGNRDGVNAPVAIVVIGVFAPGIVVFQST